MLWCYIKSKTKKVKDPKTGKERLVAYGPSRGVLVAADKDGRFGVGWSLVNSKHDTFNVATGTKMAEGRAKSLLAKDPKDPDPEKRPILKIPASIAKQVDAFISRAKRYYKDEKFADFSIVTDQQLLTQSEEAKLKKIFDSKPDEAPAISGDHLPSAEDLIKVRRTVLGLPEGVNDFFFQAGKDTLLIRKVDKVWKVEKV